MENIEQLQIRRNRLLAITALLFFVWQGATLVAELPESGDSLSPGIDLVAASGGLGWIAVTVATLLYGRRVARARATGVLNDERTEHNRNRATQWSYCNMVVAIALFFVASFVFELQVEAVIRGMLIVAVVSPLLSFVWFERHDLVVEHDE